MDGEASHSTLTQSQPVLEPALSRRKPVMVVSVSAQDGIVALGKAHTRSAPPLSSLPKVALKYLLRVDTRVSVVVPLV